MQKHLKPALSLLFGMAAASAGISQAASLQQQLQALRQLDDDIVDDREKVMRLEQQLAQKLTGKGPQRREALSDTDLRDLYEAARLTASYANSVASANAMKWTLQELERRQLAPDGAADDLIAALVSARLFEQAHACYDSHRDTATLAPPKFEDRQRSPTRPSFLSVSEGGRRSVL
jgi:hypothetical protein